MVNKKLNLLRIKEKEKEKINSQTGVNKLNNKLKK